MARDRIRRGGRSRCDPAGRLRWRRRRRRRGQTVTATDGKVTIEARDTKFDVETINATPGDLEITLVEKGNLEHTLVVEDADGEKVGDRLEVSGSGSTDSATYPLEAGEYDFYCDIPGHRGQGMEGTIVVK